MKPDSKRAAIAARAGSRPGHKIKRDAFLYLDPEGSGIGFAQCAACALWQPDSHLCSILDSKVEAGWSCGFFLPDGHHSIEPEKLVTPEQAGLYKGPVRCENCRYGGNRCALYERLNEDLPAMFDLDPAIKSKACCNAFTPKA